MENISYKITENYINGKWSLVIKTHDEDLALKIYNNNIDIPFGIALYKITEKIKEVCLFNNVENICYI